MGFGLKNTLGFLKSNAQGRASKALGIDIGAAAIKVVEIKRTENAIALSTYGELQVGPYSEQPSGATVKLEHEQAVEALVDVIRESGVTAEKAVLSVPLSSSFLTTLSINAGEEEELDKMIPVEARKHIPIPLKEVALDWYEIAQTENKEEDTIRHDILMAAIQNETLAQLQRQMIGIGRTDQITEIEAFSTIRAIGLGEEKSAIIIDLGASMSKLYIVKGSTLHRIHRFKSGGELMTKQLSNLLAVSFGEAEVIKTTYASDPQYAKDVKTAMASSLDRAMHEFKRVVQQYQNETGETISDLYLVGGGAQLDQVSEYVAEVFALQPKVFNPFSKIAYPAFMEDTLGELGSSFTVALGAALRPLLEK